MDMGVPSICENVDLLGPWPAEKNVVVGTLGDGTGGSGQDLAGARGSGAVRS